MNIRGKICAPWPILIFIKRKRSAVLLIKGSVPNMNGNGPAKGDLITASLTEINSIATAATLGAEMVPTERSPSQEDSKDVGATTEFTIWAGTSQNGHLLPTDREVNGKQCEGDLQIALIGMSAAPAGVQWPPPEKRKISAFAVAQIPKNKSFINPPKRKNRDWRKKCYWYFGAK